MSEWEREMLALIVMRTYQRAWPAFSFSSSGTKVFVQSLWETCILELLGNNWQVSMVFIVYIQCIFIVTFSFSIILLYNCMYHIYSHLSRELGLFQNTCMHLHWVTCFLQNPFEINDAFICVISSLDADGKVTVKFGILFADDRCANLFEALVGTLRAAKRKKIVTYDGELLLQGVHDNVDIILL